MTREQLLASGLSHRTVSRRLRDGELVTLHPGIYTVAGCPDTFERRVAAAVLAAAPGAVASHRCAAFLLGLAEIDPRVEVSIPTILRRRLRRVRVHRVSVLRREHVTFIRGLPVTTPARTLCDLAGVLGAKSVELILDQGLARRRFSIADVRVVLATLAPNTRGAGLLRKLLAKRPDGHARVESPLEQRLQDLLERVGIGGWTPNRRGDGRRLDLVFEAARLVLEVDSYLHHSSRSDWERDHTRNADLVAAGWRILPVTSGDLRQEEVLLRRVRAALSPVPVP